MKLVRDADLVSFLKAVSQCREDVWFRDGEGDVLNLKSTLSQYVFMVTVARPELLASGRIECSNPDDEALLHRFMTED